MGILGGELGYQILKHISPNGHTAEGPPSAYVNESKLRTLLGDLFLNQIKNKVVLDFGCGLGAEAVEMARLGAKKVIGVDIQEESLQVARQHAVEAGVTDICNFTTTTRELVDIIVAIDSFEHFHDPAAILREMRRLIKPDGCVITSFGPTWYHPLGGHLFSVFPWAHLLFTERALIRWRGNFKDDGATSFHEVAGGLNQLTIRRFVNLVEQSPFKIATFETVPIRGLQKLANRLTREFITSIVRCKLVPA